MEPEEDTKFYNRKSYADKDFWNDRFKESDGFFDWYANWSQLKNYIEALIKPEDNPKILMVGCGNSRLSGEMYNDGYTNITNIDISDVVIEKMKTVYSESCPLMTWQVADATNMSEFEDGQFDMVIDNSDLHPELKLLKEMMRVTKPSMFIFEISNGTPNKRENIFKEYTEKVVYRKIQLSPMAKLINILRSASNSSGECKSLKEAIQDPKLMKYALLEMLRTNEDDKDEEEPTTAKQKLKRLAKKIYMKKVEDEAAEFLQSQESEGEIKKVEGYNPLRQDFVMLYTLRKADPLKDVEKNDI